MSVPGQLLGRWVEACEHRPRQVLLAVALITALAAVYAGTNLSINSDLSKLIRPSDALPWYRANEELKARFPEQQQTAVVVVSGPEAAAVDRTASRLRAALSDRNAFEFVFAPALDHFLRAHRAYFLETPVLEDWIAGVQYDYGAMLRLADSAGLADALFTLADQVAATNGLRLPTALRSLAEGFQDGVPASLDLQAYPHLLPQAQVHYLILVVKGQQRLDQQLPNEAQVALLRETIAATEVDAGVQVRLTGEVPLAHEEIRTALDGIGIAGLVSLILLGVILHFGVRSWRIICATFLLLGTGVVWTLAFAAATVGSFNTLALIFVVMFFGLGVDFSVHFSLRLREGMDSDSREDAEVHVAREIGPALLLCMITSSLAFLSFVPTAYLGLGELGIISAGGMVIALVLTLTLLPAFYSLSGIPLPMPVRQSRRVPGSSLSPRLVLSLTGCLALAALWMAKDIDFDYSVLALRDAHTEAMSTLLELQSNGVSTDYSISLLAEDEAAARALAARLEALPQTGSVMTPMSLVPEDQKEKAQLLSVLQPLLDGIKQVQPARPEDAIEELRSALSYLAEVRAERPTALAGQDRGLVDAFVDGLRSLESRPEVLAGLNEQLRRALEAELNDLLSIASAAPFEFADLPEDLRRRFVTEDGRLLVTVMPAAAIDTRAATDAFVGAVSSVMPAIGGRAVVEWGVGGVVVVSFLQAVTLAIVAITILLVIHFRGLVLPAIVLVPLLLTTVITFALIEVFGLTLNMANILVVPLIFGLGVDTGIHVVHRFSRATDLDSVMGSSTTRAVVISALTTIGTFFSLSFSPHKGAASIGLLLTIAIFTMLMVTLLVVPALLRLFRPTAAGSEAA